MTESHRRELATNDDKLSGSALRAAETIGERSARAPLDWFPQKFEPGVIQGEGAKKLLGTPNVSTGELLVRETAQNSWDARTGREPVEFTINLRKLGRQTCKLLRERVFTGPTPGTGIQDVLQADEVWAVEISDRGTVGLGGPVRNDKAIPPNSVTHFIDLVFNIGATKGDPTSAGTYGFGKSIAYLVSRISAIIIWSRCETDQGIEDRLIASAIGDVFELDGYRYTGRHWWGKTVEDRPEPLVGQDAHELGSSIFAKSFEGSELGTSILILAPELGAPGPEDDADVLANAVLWNLWPKLVPDDTGVNPMIVRVQVEGADHPIPDPATHPVLSGHVDCLRAVRAIQSGKTPPSTLFKVEVVEIKRYSEVLGHLALTKYPLPPDLPAEDGSHSVSLMRHGAELVVRRIERRPLAEPGLQWAGVFKPVAILDPTFAKSEPPAHDDWSPASLRDKTQRSQVKLALEKIQQAADRFVEPDSSSKSRQSSTSAAAVGDMLAGLMSGALGSAPTSAKSRTAATRGGGRRRNKGVVLLGEPHWDTCETPGWTRTYIPVSVEGGPSEGSFVRVKIGIGTEFGTERTTDTNFVRDGGWVGSDGESTALIRPNEFREYWFESSNQVAVDVTTEIISELANE